MTFGLAAVRTKSQSATCNSRRLFSRRPEGGCVRWPGSWTKCRRGVMANPVIQPRGVRLPATPSRMGPPVPWLYAPEARADLTALRVMHFRVAPHEICCSLLWRTDGRVAAHILAATAALLLLLLPPQLTTFWAGGVRERARLLAPRPCPDLLCTGARHSGTLIKARTGHLNRHGVCASVMAGDEVNATGEHSPARNAGKRNRPSDCDRTNQPPACPTHPSSWDPKCDKGRLVPSPVCALAIISAVSTCRGVTVSMDYCVVLLCVLDATATLSYPNRTTLAALAPSTQAPRQRS